MPTSKLPHGKFRGSADFWESLQKCKLPVEAAYCLPPLCYCSAEIQQLEIDAIFTKNWIGIGRADRFDSPGHYETLDIVGVPLLLVSDREGKLHAFNNSCRHRSARLLDGEGSCRIIRCPFHSWTYGLDGHFVTAPHMEHTKNFDPSDSGLIEFTVEVHAGFVFLCMDKNPPSLAEHLGNFDELHTAWPLDTLLTTRRQSLSINCNWKQFLDVFNEYYHLSFVHPTTIDDIYNLPETADVTTGAVASQFGDTDGTGALLQDQQDYALPPIPGLNGRATQGARYTWIFPNMTFAAGTDSLWVYEAYPINPNQTQVFQSLCFPPETVALPDFKSKSEFYYQRIDAALEEDREALENQYKGLSSPFARQGRYASHLEANVASFGRWYASRLDA